MIGGLTFVRLLFLLTARLTKKLTKNSAFSAVSYRRAVGLRGTNGVSLRQKSLYTCLMKLDAALPPIQLNDVPAIAKAAEEIGFAALWTQETQHDPFLPCALIAEHSAKMQFGTAIAVSFARSPANLAYTAWDLASQSNGRFILGLGTQVKAHIERRFSMPWPESVTKKLREQILVIRAF